MTYNQFPDDEYTFDPNLLTNPFLAVSNPPSKVTSNGLQRMGFLTG